MECVMPVSPDVELYTDAWNNVRYANLRTTEWYAFNLNLFNDLWEEVTHRAYPAMYLKKAVMKGRLIDAHKNWLMKGSF